jgi:phthiocerol/phenolphthiocerol synthesis type-I polyketide synthase B
MSAGHAAQRPIPVAIVGIGCRFPGGVTDASRFWKLLSEGCDAVTEIPNSRIDVARYFDPRPATPGRMSTRWGGFLPHIDEFDADFFRISPREAECLDPQQRLLLETAWEAFEDAGQDISRLEGTPVGVFIGQWLSDFEGRLLAEPETMDFHKVEGSGRYASSGRISYALGLRGPSLTVDTACSSSLVAVHLAVRSIRAGESRMALAGGVNIILQPHVSIAYSQSRMMAADGRCKFGDASGDGYVRSEGVGIIVLKPLADALADGDRIYALIRGSAVNNDGASSGSIGTPSRIGQEELLRAAYADAGVPAAWAGYFEAHGTGTRAGDPVELGALASVIGDTCGPDHRTFVGSVKTNIGHTEGAAGVAGLIKVALALQHRAIPPSLHFNEPNPRIAWSEMPCAIPRTLMDWPETNHRRIGGVSAFGISGTNAHVVLEEFVPPVSPDVQLPAPGNYMLPLSARSPQALRALVGRYAALLESETAPALLHLCKNVAIRKTPLEHRIVFVAADLSAMVAQLRSYAEDAAAVQGVVNGDAAPKIAFVVPGQGAQWVGMARELVVRAPAFSAALHLCDAAARRYVDWSIIDQLHRDPGTASYRLDRIDVIQPVLVAIAIAYAALWRSFGIEPDAVVGHSMGEIGAAYIAGILDLDRAMQIVCRRSALMHRLSGKGAMALIDLSAEETVARLAGCGGSVSLAASNSPRSSVISGDPEGVKQVMARLAGDDVFCRLVQVDVASHSPQMDQLAAELADDLIGLSPNASRIPIYSTVFGRRTEARAFDASYWKSNLRRPVLFADAVTGMIGDGITSFVEIGPHPILSHSLQQTARSLGQEVTTVSCGRRDSPEHASAMLALGQLWAVGHPIDWDRVMPGSSRTVSLPFYPWQRQRYWSEAAEISSAAPGNRDVKHRSGQEDRGWLHRLEWELSDLPGSGARQAATHDWLLLSADVEAGAAVGAACASHQVNAVLATLGQLESQVDEFATRADSSSTIVVVAPNALGAAFLPLQVLQAITRANWKIPPRLWLVTSGAQAVLPGTSGALERISVEQAALWGAGRAIAEEHPDVWGGLVDLDPANSHATNATLLVNHLLNRDGEDQVAFRSGRRYVLRLKAIDPESRTPAFAWRSDGAYLVTGGLGSVGLHVARAMAHQGVRRLVLIGRSELPPREGWAAEAPRTSVGERVAAVRELEALGVAVHVASVDVSDEHQLTRFLERYRAEAWPPIRGVIHAAAVLAHGLASQMEPAAFDKVLDAKLRGAQLLDRLLPEAELFVVFSSITAFLPHAGISNYAAANAGLDGLVQDRRARGLSGLSIAWGTWENIGFAAEGGNSGVTELRRQGIRALPPERAAALFSWLCGRAEAAIAILPIDWATFRNARKGRNSALFSKVWDATGPAVSQPSTWSERLAAAEPGERRQLLDEIVRNGVGTVLKISPARLDPKRAFGSLGLTSLMALELRNNLEAATGLPLSATLVWNYPTITALVAHLASAWTGAASSAAQPEHREAAFAASGEFGCLAEMSDIEAVAALRERRRQ